MSPSQAITLRAQLSTEQSSREHFEILFIQAAEANGFTFPRAVLEESAPLWENISCFVDHSLWGHSVRDLGGVLSDVKFSTENNGLTATLTPAGPSKEIVLEAALILLSDEPHPDLGFSVDIIFTADSLNTVEKIMQPLSVDLVIDPAFATKFLRQLNSKGANMPVPVTTPTPAPAAVDETAAMRQVLQAQHVESCRELLRLKLSNSELPEPAIAELRTRFDGHTFEPAELDNAVKAWRDSLAAVTAPAQIS